jgi:hypothetical protein
MNMILFNFFIFFLTGKKCKFPNMIYTPLIDEVLGVIDPIVTLVDESSNHLDGTWSIQNTATHGRTWLSGRANYNVQYDGSKYTSGSDFANLSSMTYEQIDTFALAGKLYAPWSGIYRGQSGDGTNAWNQGKITGTHRGEFLVFGYSEPQSLNKIVIGPDISRTRNYPGKIAIYGSNVNTFDNFSGDWIFIEEKDFRPQWEALENALQPDPVSTWSNGPDSMSSWRVTAEISDLTKYSHHRIVILTMGNPKIGSAFGYQIGIRKIGLYTSTRVQ